MTVTKKIGLMLFLPAFGTLLALGIFQSFLVKTATDGPFINIAGRQRMLSQQLFAYANMVKNGHEDHRDGLLELVHVFSESIQVLEHGGRVADRILPPAPAEVLEEIAQVKEIWERYKKALLLLADMPADNRNVREAYEYVQLNLKRLTDASDQVVTAYEQRSHDLRGRMFYTLLAILALDLILLVVGIWIMKSYLAERARSENELVSYRENLEDAVRERTSELAESNKTLEYEIVQRKKVEEELIKHREHLEELVAERTEELSSANKELETFSYSVSHDLRAPLRAINGFSQALLEDYYSKLDEHGRDYLHRVRSATQNMGELIDDLLTLSMVVRSEIYYTTVYLSSLVHSIANELQKTEPGRTVEFIIADDLVVNGDQRLLRVALHNIIGNAWKFTGHETKALIEFGSVKQDGDKIYFIRDNGVGFNMQYANKLFAPFQRLHSPKEFEGTGIGLATVQRVIHRHGGLIWAEGRLGKGATFFFTL